MNPERQAPAKKPGSADALPVVLQMVRTASRDGSPSQPAGEDRLQIFLFAGARLRRNVLGDGAIGDLSERALAGEDRVALFAVPAGIALLDEPGQDPVVQRLLGVQQ